MTTQPQSIQDRLAALRAETPEAPAPAAPQPTAPRTVRPNVAPNGAKTNIHPGRCRNCNRWVPAGQGRLAGKVNGKWAVAHFACDPNAAPSPAEPKADDAASPHPGIYTVENAEGHTTFRVYKQADDADFAPGELLLQQLTGQDNTGDYTSKAFIKGGRLVIWKRHRPADGDEIPQWITDARRLLADPESVLEAKNCVKCNRILSTPESIEAGIGPVCAQGGWDA